MAAALERLMKWVEETESESDGEESELDREESELDREESESDGEESEKSEFGEGEE